MMTYPTVLMMFEGEKVWPDEGAEDGEEEGAEPSE